MVARGSVKQEPSPEINPALLARLKELRRNCGQRKFTSIDDRSYTQWKTEAENLVIRIFGRASNQYNQFANITHRYGASKPKKPEQSSNKDVWTEVRKLGYTDDQIEKMSDEEWDRIVKENRILKKLEKEDKEAQVLYENKLQENTETFKNEMSDVFSAWIKELELFMPLEELHYAPRSSRGATIKNTLKQELSVSVLVDIDNAVRSIIDDIKANEPSEERLKEAEERLEQFKEEVKKEKPSWSVIKKILEWALNFGRDVFLQILPILLEKYKNPK